MSGPIVRTGTTPKFWENWDRVFGEKKRKSRSKSTVKNTISKTRLRKSDRKKSKQD